MKTPRLFATLLVLTSTIALFAQSPQSPALQITPTNRVISISASDHAEADPDIADIDVGFTAYGPTLAATYKAAADTSNTIIKALIAAGAQRSEIQSRSQRVSRLSDYEIKTRKGMQYSVVQSWVVSVEPKIAALILDAAIQSGANQSGDISWRMKSSVTLDSEALHRATERAHALASELAKTMGVTLGKPLYATNTINNNLSSPQIMMNGYAAKQRVSAPEAPLVIEEQRVQSVATVQIIFSIE